MTTAAVPNLPAGAPVAPVAPVGPAGRGPGRPDHRRPPSDRHSPEDLHRLAGLLAVVWLEIQAGRRSRRQLRRVITPELDARLAEVVVDPGPVSRLLRVHGRVISDTRYEAVALVRSGPRVTAVGLSLARQGKRWLLDDVAQPEHGPLPPASYALPGDDPDAFDLVLD